MKLIKACFIILMCTLLLMGCQGIENLNVAQTIAPPKNNRIPIKGTWIIKDYKRISDLQEKQEIIDYSEGQLGKVSLFTQDWAVVADEKCTETQYQIRRVNTEDYFLFHYNVDFKELDIEKETIEIISITSNGALFFDIIKIDEDRAVVYADKCFYWLEKVSDNVETSHNDKENVLKEDDNDKDKGEDIIRSGLFLGLRSTLVPDMENEYGSRSAYRTLWISSYNRNVGSILETPNIFLPRRSGFWALDVSTRKIGELIQDHFSLVPVGSAGVNFVESDETNELSLIPEKNIKKNILFLSDDYIAVEYSETEAGEIKEPNNYRVLPLDDANSQKGIKISNIAHEDMKDIFYKSAQSHLVSKGIRELDALQERGSDDNFTIARRNGHWILKGRLKLDGRNEDFNIAFMPEGKFLNYDKLHVSWDEIKEKIPMALDAYTSPAKDLLIVVTSNFVMVYTIDGGQISEKPAKKIDLKKGETVIMAEWATGDYVALWEKGFNQLNPFIVSE
ncbi:MAG: hypothetical protein GX352_08850 [Clostridiales bacterium]|nr:hypothetical protein [Clostridiales bacterium]